jgi:hypothetical protein
MNKRKKINGEVFLGHINRRNKAKVKEQFENLREMLNKKPDAELAPETCRQFQELFK